MVGWWGFHISPPHHLMSLDRRPFLAQIKRGSSAAAPAEREGTRCPACNAENEMEDGDGKDCGITQTRTTISRYSCRQLRNSYWLGFSEAAREMVE